MGDLMATAVIQFTAGLCVFCCAWGLRGLSQRTVRRAQNIGWGCIVGIPPCAVVLGAINRGIRNIEDFEGWLFVGALAAIPLLILLLVLRTRWMRGRCTPALRPDSN